MELRRRLGTALAACCLAVPAGGTEGSAPAPAVRDEAARAAPATPVAAAAGPVFSSPLGARATIRMVAPAGGRALGSIRVVNAGSAPLVVSGPEGALGAPLAVRPTAPVSVLPGDDHWIFVTCDPVPAGTVVGTLRYTTNDPATPRAAYRVECSGFTAHSLLTELLRTLHTYGIEPSLEQRVRGRLEEARRLVAGGEDTRACAAMEAALDDVRSSGGAGVTPREHLLQRMGEVVAVLPC